MIRLLTILNILLAATVVALAVKVHGLTKQVNNK